MTTDPFGTAPLRAATLATWSAQPARFREDANAEEDHGRGWYRDRVVVELAQNAADAAGRAGVPGRLLLRLTTDGDGGRLVAANTGTPLDAAGVASLASLRASAKRDAEAPLVGRFGVGFAAVRSVADEIAVVSTTGAVHFSLARTRRLLADAAGDLAAEVARRDGSLPVLRLPFDGAGPPALAVPGARSLPDGGWATAVVLELRDRSAVAAVREQLAAVGDALALALPALHRIEVVEDGRVRVVDGVTDRWVVATRTGALPDGLLADRPVEERERTTWSITWAAPRAGGQGWPVHAPTPTDDPCTVPALLLGTFPLDPSRRRVAAGALTDHLVAQAGEVWADLLVACRDATAARADAPHPVDLVPTGLPAAALDAALRGTVLTASRQVALLPPAGGEGAPMTAGQAVVLDGPAGSDPGAVAALGRWFPDLTPARPRDRDALRALGVGRVELADLVDALPLLVPGDLRRLLDAFAGADRSIVEALATVPVPLADGRTVRGARGLVLPPDGVDAALLRTLGRWGVRLVHPRAVHPLLERLGAQSADAAALLRHPVLRARVLGDADAAPDPDDDADTSHPDDPDDPDDAADPEDAADPDEAGADTADPDGAADPTGHSRDVAGLRLEALADLEPTAAVMVQLAAGAASAVPEPWWGEVLLPADDGEAMPARGLVLPGSDAARWFDPEVLPPVRASLAAAHGPALELLGVRTGLTVVALPAAALDEPDEDTELLLAALPGWEDYREDGRVPDRPDAPALPDGVRLLAVADLDAVRASAWPEVLAALGRGPARQALVGRMAGAGGPAAPSYTAWWLRTRAGLGLDRPFALPGAPRWAGLLAAPPDAVAHLDPDLQRALGGVGEPDDLDAGGWTALLAALPAEGRTLDPTAAVAVWRGLARWAVQGRGPLDADRLPALDAGGRVLVAAAEDVAVADPRWAQHVDVGPVLVVPSDAVEAVAEALDLDTAAERAPGRVTSRGVPADVPDAVTSAFPRAPRRWVEHEDLRVDGRPVDWWVAEAGDGPTVHAATTAGLAAGLAGTVGWVHRDTIRRLLLEPDDTHGVLLDRAGDPADDADL